VLAITDGAAAQL